MGGKARRTAFAGLPILVALVMSPTSAAADSDHPALDAAVKNVHQAAVYSERVLAANGKRVSHTFVVANAAMNYVAGRVNAAEYGFKATKGPTGEPSGNDADLAEWTLEQSAGICGHAALVMGQILTRLHVPWRRVNVYYKTPDAQVNGHSTVEVRYGGKWHWFDPTWGTTYVKPGRRADNVMRLVDVVRLSPRQRQRSRIANNSLFWAQIVKLAGKGLARETGLLFTEFRHLYVEIGGKVVYRQ